MSSQSPKRPREQYQLAKLMVDIATGETSDTVPASSPMAELGRTGGRGAAKHEPKA